MDRSDRQATWDVERYLNIRSAGSPSFDPSGDTLSFLMDTTGVPQVWCLDAPAVWPEQRTFYEERVTFASWAPERRELVFGMDHGGNERNQFFRLDDDGQVVDLTATPEAKHWWGGWNSDGSQFAFTSNRRSEAVFDVYIQGRDATGDDATRVYDGEGWLSVSGWSPDDSRLIVHEACSNYDMNVYVLDLETEKLRHVTPHEGDVRYGSVEWSPAGTGLFLTTDEGADTTYLGWLDLETLEIERVIEGGDWNIDSVVVEEETGRTAYTRNVDGYAELTIGKVSEERAIVDTQAVSLPKGVVGGLDFDPDVERLAVAVSGDTQNTNVYVIDINTGNPVRWTRAPTAGIPPERFVEPELVYYETFDNQEIPAFFSTPLGDSEAFPVIVDIHGGPESQRRPSFSPVKQYFLDAGYAVFEPNVRGSTGYGKTYSRLDDKRNRMDAVRDLDAGVEWLTEHPDVDPDRIVALGGSYGGFMVLAALTEYPDRWAAGIDIVGIANFVTFLENTGDWRRSLREAEYGSLAEDRDFLEEISPINNIARIEAPLLVLHGANDPRVPVSEAEQIVDEAAKRVPTEKLIFEDEGHGFSKLENRIEAYRTVVEFLDSHV